MGPMGDTVFSAVVKLKHYPHAHKLVKYRAVSPYYSEKTHVLNLERPRNLLLPLLDSVSLS